MDWRSMGCGFSSADVKSPEEEDKKKNNGSSGCFEKELGGDESEGKGVKKKKKGKQGGEIYILKQL